MALTIQPLWILSILVIVCAIFALWAFKTLRTQIAQLQRDFERQINALLALQGALKVLSGEAINHRQDQAAVLRALERLANINQETRLETRLRDADRSPYSHAIQLIRHGQSREAVRKICALTESEVDLLFNLHGQGIAFGEDAGNHSSRLIVEPPLTKQDHDVSNDRPPPSSSMTTDNETY
jgi:hypothetical protein